MLNIIYWNCAGGAKNKLDEIKRLIGQTSADLFFVGEAEVTPNSSPFLNITGYELLLAPTEKLGKARVACYIKDCLRGLFTLKGNHVYEDLIYLESQQLNVVGLYQLPLGLGAAR